MLIPLTRSAGQDDNGTPHAYRTARMIVTTGNRQASCPDVNEIMDDMSRLDFDADYARLLEGKSVIVVGPAETLLGTGQGRVIDSFDLVVRFNTAIEYMPFADELARDIGARTDILYCNTEVLCDDIVGQQRLSHEQFIRACEEVGIKYFVGTNNDYAHAPSDSQSRKGEAKLAEFQNFLDAFGVRSKCRMLFSTPDTVRAWLRGYIGRTGFIGIVDLLRYDIRSLHITGMTFYHKGGHLFLKNCVGELDPLRNHLGILPEHMLGHNSYLELQLIKTLGECFERKLQLDEQVRKLLEEGGGERLASD